MINEIIKSQFGHFVIQKLFLLEKEVLMDKFLKNLRKTLPKFHDKKKIKRWSKLLNKYCKDNDYQNNYEDFDFDPNVKNMKYEEQEMLNYNQFNDNKISNKRSNYFLNNGYNVNTEIPNYNLISNNNFHFSNNLNNPNQIINQTGFNYQHTFSNYGTNNITPLNAHLNNNFDCNNIYYSQVNRNNGLKNPYFSK